MEKRELVLKNLILKVRFGSHLYGTNTPESDEDFMGIFVPDAEHLIGLDKLDEVDMSVKSKDVFGKNTKDALDFKIFSLEKFVRLALDNNPNIIDILFVNEENIVFINDVGKQLLDLRYEFLSKNIKQRFIGYARSQKHKMVIKLDNFEKITEAYNYISEKSDRFKFLLELMESTHHPLFVKNKDYVIIGDINIPITSTIKKVKTILYGRISKFGSRKELVTEYGFDTKFASHMIRLLKEGQELLETGDLKFPLQSRELLKDIRYGKYTMNDVLALSDIIEREIEDLYKISTILDEPNRKVANYFVIDTHRKYILED